jgi:hypothetical protein
MRVIAAVVSFLAAAHVQADDEPDVPAHTCEQIFESPLPDDDVFFNFMQVKDDDQLP